jgi:hypothetical protein
MTPNGKGSVNEIAMFSRAVGAFGRVTRLAPPSFLSAGRVAPEGVRQRALRWLVRTPPNSSGKLLTLQLSGLAAGGWAGLHSSGLRFLHSRRC